MNFAHGVTRLRIRRRRDGAGVEHHEIGRRVVLHRSESSAHQVRKRMRGGASASVARQPKFSMEKVAIQYRSRLWSEVPGEIIARIIKWGVHLRRAKAM